MTPTLTSVLKNFNELSGPWTGYSVQFGQKITEKIHLSIFNGQISGTGSDKDGDFELVGFYKERSQKVTLTRRYSWTTEPSQEGAGMPYDYEGKWDGALVFGDWHSRVGPSDGGPFEMWPDRDSDRQELRIELEETRPLALPSPSPRQNNHAILLNF